MKQQTLAMAADQNVQFEKYRRPTRRDEFLATMERIVPWAALCEVIEPHYPKPGNGRPPVGLERMLRMYFVQHWFNLADAACEDALLDSTALRRFVGIDLGRERVPDATTLLKFRRKLQEHKLGEALLAKVGQVLQAHGLKVRPAVVLRHCISWYARVRGEPERSAKVVPRQIAPGLLDPASLEMLQTLVAAGALVRAGGEPGLIGLANPDFIETEIMQRWFEEDRDFLVWRQELESFLEMWLRSGRNSGPHVAGLRRL
jgi:hypothetical protein